MELLLSRLNENVTLLPFLSKIINSFKYFNAIAKTQ